MPKNISPSSHIIIKGARQHNLKNLDLTLPKNQLIVFTGLSGSGKSSLAFDTIYAEGQRRYVESLSSYARQFLGIMDKPDVDQIEGLSPAISIDQKTTSHNPRSTVGTITEIYDYLRLLYARVGHPHCPNCGAEIAPQSPDQIKDSILKIIKENTNAEPSRWMLLSPVVRRRKGEFAGLFDNLKSQGYQRARIDGQIYDLSEELILIKTNRHTIAPVLDRLSITKDNLKGDKSKKLEKRLSQSLEPALELSDGLVILSKVNDQSLEFPDKPKEMKDHLFSQHLACANCNLSLQPLEPRLFSFNTPHGACENCDGLGNILEFDQQKFLAPDLTLSEGAVVPLSHAFSNNTWFAKKARSFMEHHDIAYKTPWKLLPENIQEKLLKGSQEEITVTGKNNQGQETSFRDQFPGILTELERRYEETSSDYVRNQLEKFMTKETCPECLGSRLKPTALAVTILEKNIYDIVSLDIKSAQQFIQKITDILNHDDTQKLTKSEKTIAAPIIKEVNSRLKFLVSVGLEYLTLEREAGTLAGGEAQRIRLASQIGTGLTGVLYVLDEPTIGLHPRDNNRLIQTLRELKNLGNTLIVVEHDKHVILAADHVVDFGPGAGNLGGEIVVADSPQALKKDSNSITGQYLANKKAVTQKKLDKLTQKLHLHFPPKDTKVGKNKTLTLTGAREHNLNNLKVDFPLGKLTVVTGVSGSGKSTLIHDTLYPAIKIGLDQKIESVGQFDNLEGIQHVDRVSLIDQSPIGRTPRSNPATYTKAFDYIRKLFAQTQEAKQRGYKPGRFSFNVKGGRCEACSGDGQVKISMQFLSDVYVTCEVCGGLRYNNETLNIKYKDQSIADVLDMTIDEAAELFKNQSALARKLATLKAVGLGYIRLGQPAPTLSGGEAQRVKLAKELSTLSSGHTVYLLDEPTTGLHFEDVKNLLVVLKQLVNHDNTVIVIEHNLDVIKTADHIIDLGPEGGHAGGRVVATGTPQDIAKTDSHTAHYLKQEL